MHLGRTRKREVNASQSIVIDRIEEGETYEELTKRSFDARKHRSPVSFLR